MQASNQQLVLSGVFVVGVIALGVDRLVLSDGVSGPALAAASPELTPPAATVDAPGTMLPSLSQRIREVALYSNIDLEQTTDAFSFEERDASLRPPMDAEMMSTNERAFRETHRLIGVMANRPTSQQDPMQVSYTAFVEVLGPDESQLNVARLSIGDVIDGFTISQLGLPGTDKAPSPFIVLLRNGVTFRLFTTDGR